MTIKYIGHKRLYKLKIGIFRNCFNTEPTLVVIDGSVKYLQMILTMYLKNLRDYMFFLKNKILNLKIDKEASVLIGSVAELSIDYNIKEYQELTNDNILLLSDYTVDKPWGGETWFSQNIDNYPYAQNIIWKGFQSSLQSHKFKVKRI